jgi:hypothetical protein
MTSQSSLPPMSGRLIDGLMSTVEHIEPSSGPRFSHEHTCSACGSVCFCDWAGCDPTNEGTCQACLSWLEGR